VLSHFSASLILSCTSACFFFFNATAPSEIYTLSLHDALPISYEFSQKYFGTKLVSIERSCNPEHFDMHLETVQRDFVSMVPMARSEEHTSELQSRFDLVCRLLLEKKKKKKTNKSRDHLYLEEL